MSMDYGDRIYLQRLIEQNDDALESEIGLEAASIGQVARNLREIALVLNATLEALHQAGVVDANAIFARVQQQLKDPAMQPVQCIQCSKVVPRSLATQSPLGIVCKACAS